MLRTRGEAVALITSKPVFVFCVVAMLILLSVPAGAADSTAGVTLPSGVHVTVGDGRTMAPASVGSVVAQGTLTPGFDACSFSTPSVIGGSIPDDVGPIALSITTHMDSSCTVRITSILVSPNPPTEPSGSGAAPASEVYHRGWAFHTVFEYVNITVTEERVKMTYTRNGSQVYDGRDRFGQDYTDILPWHTDLEAYNWDPDGPTAVFNYRRTHYSSLLPPKPGYTISARFTADPGARFTCGWYQGTLPLGWDRTCSGGLYW
jgi:hypothetical protein